MLLLDRCQVLVVLSYCRCFSSVTLYGLIGARRIAVVHQPITEAQSPEWRSAKLVCGGLVEVFGLGGLGDAVSCTDIMKQEIAVGMNDRIADELGDLVHAAVDSGPWPQGLVARDVANRAADLVKQLLARQGFGAGCEVFMSLSTQICRPI